jgi:hypothetical protein
VAEIPCIDFAALTAAYNREPYFALMPVTAMQGDLAAGDTSVALGPAARGADPGVRPRARRCQRVCARLPRGRAGGGGPRLRRRGRRRGSPRRRADVSQPAAVCGGLPPRPTVSLDVISLVASSCGDYRGHSEHRAAHAFAVHVATQRGLAERPPHRHPPRAQPVAPLRECHCRRPC